MQKVLLPIFYLPPISWFSEFLKEGNEVVLEQFENFPKQTYRNRACIYGANGKLPLIIPIHHNGKRAMKDIEISYAENWQSLHWKSIKTAYQSSPYFEYYEHQLSKIYKNQPKFLLDFNLKALEIVQGILKSQKEFSLNTEYEKEPSEKDFRDLFSAKKTIEMPSKEYYQTFLDKMGFLPDLSIIDLICNLGPEAKSFVS
ncbi:MAG: WbqC family protein [Flavobacteriaceae bacterium]|nr:WbqC family protein [Flavobacteriaceae bacterium]